MLTLLLNQNESSFSSLEKVDPNYGIEGLGIRDAIDGLNRDVIGTKSWDSSYLQSLALSFGPLSFQEIGTEMSRGTTKAIWSKNFSKAIIKAAFNKHPVLCNLLVLYYDENQRIVTSEAKSLRSSKHSDHYMFLSDSYLQVSTLGAYYIGLYIENVTYLSKSFVGPQSVASLFMCCV